MLFGFLGAMLLSNILKPKPPPAVDDRASQAEAERARLQAAEARRRAGRTSTIFTSGLMGLAAPAPPSGAKTLLGE